MDHRPEQAGESRGLIMLKKAALLLLLSLTLYGFVDNPRLDPATQQLLKNEKVVYEYDEAIYLTNGLGQKAMKVLESVRPSYLNSTPTLSPDGTRIAYPVGDYQIRLLSLDDRKETMIYQASVEELRSPFLNRAVRSPIWSSDGEEVFFLVANRILAYRLDERKIREVSRLSRWHGSYRVRDEYMRLSRDGKKVFAIVNGPSKSLPRRCIWQIELESGRAIKLWSEIPWHILGQHPRFRRFRHSPSSQELGQEAFEALYGSKGFPVREPIFSKDRRFYFYYAQREGFMAKGWIGGYDTVRKTPFEVKTLWRSIYKE